MIIGTHPSTNRYGWLKVSRILRIGNADVRNILARMLDLLEVDKDTRIPHHAHVTFEFVVDARQGTSEIEHEVMKHMTDILGKPPLNLTIRGVPHEDRSFGNSTKSVQVDCRLNPFEPIKEGDSHEKA